MFRILCDLSSGNTELCLTEITRSGSQVGLTSRDSIPNRGRILCSSPKLQNRPLGPTNFLFNGYGWGRALSSWRGHDNSTFTFL